MPVVFADRLMAAMLNAGGVSASELARRVWGTIKDTRGYDVPRNRDRVGHYLRGTSHPNAANLAKIATALNVPVTELTGDEVMETFIRLRSRSLIYDIRRDAIVCIQSESDVNPETCVVHLTSGLSLTVIGPASEILKVLDDNA